MSKYMLMFSLGPVQSFIAQARKTRDLWLGSFLLSTLMEAGMKEIDKTNLIFPSKPYIENNIPDLPNKYVAIFNSLEDANECAKQSKRKINECWQAICKDIWEDIVEKSIKENRLIDELESVQKIWDREVNPEAFFEIFWAITSGDENADKYHKWLKHTQQTLEARKRLRNFSAYLEKESGKLLGEQGEKSTISGEREVLHGREASRAEVKKFWQNLTRGRLFSSREISKDGDERLDAIDTVKRFAYLAEILQKKQLDASFPSTSSIAAASFIEGLLSGYINSDSIKHWLNATEDLAENNQVKIPFLLKKVSDGPFKQAILKLDGDCYFPETFTSYHLIKDYNKSQNTANSLAKDGLKALSELIRASKLVDISPPTSYYAMIQMDGDKMGKLLGDVKGRPEHKAISQALSDFSRRVVPELVEQNYPGRLVYAGGDDVFALAPLARDLVNVQPGEVSTVLDLVNRLQQQYHHTVADAVHGEDHQKKVTASTGIAIAHHYTALSYVRRMSKEAEDTAKKHYGRNALVVTILRRSGEQTRVGCRWHYDGLSPQEQPVQLFTDFYDWFVKNQISPTCVYILLEEAVTLVKLPPEAQQSEIRRVLKRQHSEKGKISKEQIDALDALAGRIVKLAQVMDKVHTPSDDQEKQLAVELHSDTRRHGLVEVLGWLLVMEFLARKGEE